MTSLLEYSELAPRFAVYPKDAEREYLALGLIGEVGELASIRAKRLRGDSALQDDTVYSERLLSEGSDILWYLAMMLHASDESIANWTPVLPRPEIEPYMSLFDCATLAGEGFRHKHRAKMIYAFLRMLGYLEAITGKQITEIAAYNVNKLTERMNAGVLKGSGETVGERK